MLNYDEALDLAIRAVKSAGEIQKQNKDETFKIAYKGKIDLVTEIDFLCEKEIIRIIKEKYPEHEILTEETVYESTGSPYRWIIDPLDGTTNYAHRFPWYCSSVALEFEEEIKLGAAYNHNMQELFFGKRGAGAYLNNQKISASSTQKLSESFLATGFPYDLREQPDNNMDNFLNFSIQSQAVRRAGSAVIDLCYVAAGRFDGYWELKLKPWDMAVGSLLIEEAGGVISTFKGKKHNIYSREIVAGNKYIHPKMIDILTGEKQ